MDRILWIINFNSQLWYQTKDEFESSVDESTCHRDKSDKDTNQEDWSVRTQSLILFKKWLASTL